jgi:tetratricopeptide (TPR) repeat protein
MRTFSVTVVGVAALLAAPRGVRAHGDVHEQIAALTQQIEQEPRKVELFLRRGELHRAHQDWDAALADFDYAGTLEPKLPDLDFHRGVLFYEARWPLAARVALDRFLSRNTNHTEALIIRARVLLQLGQHRAAVRDFTQALGHATRPQPEIYLERAQALAAEGGACVDDALKGLDEGIQKLGPLVTLQLCAVDLEVRQKRFGAALARLDKAAAQARRTETWLARRGEILRQAGREQEARESFKAALAAIEQLPPMQRSVPAIRELEQRLREAR